MHRDENLQRARDGEEDCWIAAGATRADAVASPDRRKCSDHNAFLDMFTLVQPVETWGTVRAVRLCVR